jgi:hypothetical protein
MKLVKSSIIVLSCALATVSVQATWMRIPRPPKKDTSVVRIARGEDVYDGWHKALRMLGQGGVKNVSVRLGETRLWDVIKEEDQVVIRVAKAKL